MLRRFAVSNACVFAAGLSLLVATGCEQNQQMQTWNSPQWGSWNLFGGGTQTTNYNLQYPIGNTDILNPAAAASINTNTKSNSFSRKRNLQYAVGPTLPAKQGNGGGFPSWFGKRGPNTQPQATAPRYNATPRRTANDAGSFSHTKRFNLQYDIGETQGLNGHKVAPGRRSSSYSRNYSLQYAIGQPQPVNRRGNSFTRRSTARPASVRNSSSRSVMTGMSGGGTYVVRPGDTLISIARAQYGATHGGRWQEILGANRNLINRPDEIAPGMRLRIP